MNVIEATKSILESFHDIAGIHIDFSEAAIGSFGLMSTGDELVSEDILGGQNRQHSFFLYCVYSAVNDYERMANSGFLTALSQWLDGYAEEHDTPVTAVNGSGHIEKLTARDGMLFEIPDEAGAVVGWRYQLRIITRYTIET